jgi:hypothetical protein
MARAFRQGRGAYIHLQSPAAHQLECDGAGHVVVSVGASMPPVAFSSLCCSRDFAKTETLRRFVEPYGEAREWVRTAPAGEVARAEAGFFEGYSMEALAAGIRRYQAVGCWEGDLEIQRDLYEQALNVFQAEAARDVILEIVCLGFYEIVAAAVPRLHAGAAQTGGPPTGMLVWNLSKFPQQRSDRESLPKTENATTAKVAVTINSRCGTSAGAQAQCQSQCARSPPHQRTCWCLKGTGLPNAKRVRSMSKRLLPGSR